MFFLKFLRTKTKLIYSSYFFLFLVFVFSTPLTTIAEDFPSLKEAVKYEVHYEHSFVYEEKSMVYAIILAPSDLNFEQRAQTTLKAVFDIQKKNNLDVVRVQLKFPELKGSGQPIAEAMFSAEGENYDKNRPLKNGQWEVTASDVQFTAETLEVSGIWFSNSFKFRRAGGPGSSAIDVGRLSEFVAKELNIDREKVFLIVKEFRQGFKTPKKHWP